MTLKTVEEIVRDYLKRNKYDGLCNTNCGCGIDDLMPCESYSGSCIPAYLSVVGEECRSCAMFEFCTRQYYSEIKNDDRGRICKEEMF
jgi:hypothetical protein